MNTRPALTSDVVKCSEQSEHFAYNKISLWVRLYHWLCVYIYDSAVVVVFTFCLHLPRLWVSWRHDDQHVSRSSHSASWPRWLLDGLEAVRVMSVIHRMFLLLLGFPYLVSCHYLVAAAESSRPHAFQWFQMCHFIHLHDNRAEPTELQHPTVHAGNRAIYNAHCAIRAYLLPADIKPPLRCHRSHRLMAVSMTQSTSAAATYSTH